MNAVRTNTDQSFDVLGWWWLPDRPDRARPGNLKFSPSNGTSLSILGSLHATPDEDDLAHDDGTTSTAPSAGSNEGAGTYPVIHGRVDADLYTLRDSFVTSSAGRHSDEYSPARIRVNTVLKGKHLESFDMEGISTSFAYFSQWLGIDAFTSTDEFHKVDIRGRQGVLAEFGYSVKQQGVENIELSDGASVSIGHSVGTDYSEDARILNQYLWFSARYKDRGSIARLIDIASDMQDLVSMGTGRSAAFRRVTVRRSDLRSLSMNGTDHGEYPVDYLAQWTVKDLSDESDKPTDYEMYFSYDDIGGIEGVRRWLESAAKHRSSLGRVMASRYAEGMFVTDRLLNRAVALEMFYYLSTGNEGPHFVDRIKGCANVAGSQFSEIINHDLANWSRAIARCRNDVAHHRQKIQGDYPYHYYLAESLYFLFILCMLRDSGAPDEACDKILRNPHVAWTRPRIQAAVAAAT